MTRRALILTLLLGAAGCPEEHATTAAGEETSEAAGEPAEEVTLSFPAPDPSDPIAVHMHDLAGRLARNMEPHGPLHRGSLRRGETNDYQTVLEAGRCYKVLAVGAPEVDDLDLLLFDPNGVPAQQDTGTDPEPVLGLHEPICPGGPGVYRVQVRVFAGSGEYGMQVARSAPGLF